MSVLDQVRIIIYRVNAKGLEILLMNEDLENDPDIWGIPQYQLADIAENMIKLEDSLDGSGNFFRSVAIEADWHDIPSVRGIIKHDVKKVKSRIREILPQFEKGSYFTIKDAFKKVLPEEYKALKELKDIILDKNISNF